MKGSWSAFAKFFDGSRKRVVEAALCGLLEVILLLPVPLLVRRALDDAVPHGRVRLLILLCAALVVLRVLSAGAQLLARHLALDVTKRVISTIRRALHDKLYVMPKSWYDATDRDQITTLIVQDTERIDVMSNAILVVMLPAVITASGLSILLCVWQPLLFAGALAPIVAVVMVNRVLRPRVRARADAFRVSFDHFARRTAFTLRLMDFIRANHADELDRATHELTVDELRATSRKMAWLQTAYTQVQSVLLTLSSLTVLCLGGWLVSRGALSLGTLVAYYVALALLVSALSNVWSVVPAVIAGTASLDAITEQLAITAPPTYPSAHARPVFRHRVTMADVSFAYHERNVLRSVCMHVERGEVLGLMGASGSGKTTIAHLILSSYAPQSGTIFLDDIPYSEINNAHLRRMIGYVAQDPTVFRGTIRDNIGYGEPHATDEAIAHAAALTTLDDVVARLDHGMNTEVGHEGCTLSGGERQKICLARTLLQRPDILILDEPTVHLDETSARRILARIASLEWNPAVLVISHDDLVIEHCTRTMRIRDGILADVAQRSPARV